MEALAALGLASNVVQFISFTRELITTTQLITQNADGQLVQNLEIETIAASLQSFSSQISQTVWNSGNLATQEYNDLKELCVGCQDVAERLTEKINSLKVDKTVSGRIGKQFAGFRQALRSLLAADEIKDLERRLDRYQRTINVFLLATLT